jgi:hypothetical protein
LGAAHGRVELCSDRACEHVKQLLTGDGEARPDQALAPGVWFWRVRDLTSGGGLSGSSSTWEFVVGKESAPIDSAFGAVFDLNGDGFGDLAVPDPDVTSKPIRIYWGSPAGAAKWTTIAAPASSQWFGYTIEEAGDLNGDGLTDLVVGTPSAAFEYLGAADGIEPLPRRTLNDTALGASFAVVAGVGDINGDGFADLLVGAPSKDKAYLYLGSPSGIGAASSAVLSGPPGSSFGSSMCGAGDVNADGYSDLVVGAYLTDQAFLFLGARSGAGATPASALKGPSGSHFGLAVRGAGDLNGDGYADIAISAPFASRLFVFLGNAGGSVGPNPDKILPPPPGWGGMFGSAISLPGDVDGDGLSDIAIASMGSASGRGNACLLQGDAHLDGALISLQGGGAGFGGTISLPGDVDGDGYDDVVVMAFAEPAAYLFRGMEGGVVLPPLRLEAP